MIDGLFNSGSMPVLERVIQFTSQRQKLLNHNVANLSTPYFKPVDVDPRGFQAALSDAIDRRRQNPDPVGGPLQLSDTDQVAFNHDSVRLSPTGRHEGILFHDQNNRDVERIMQDLAENTLAHRAAVDMLRNQFEMLRIAIRERV